MGAHKEPQRTAFGTFPFEKQTTVRNKFVFIIQKYLSGYMSHCEEGFKKRKHTEMFVTMHIFVSPEQHYCGLDVCTFLRAVSCVLDIVAYVCLSVS